MHVKQGVKTGGLAVARRISSTLINVMSMASARNTMLFIGVGPLPTSIVELISISGPITNPSPGFDGATVQL